MLVIWPASKTNLITYNKHNYADACTRLSQAPTTTPSKEDRQLAEYVISHAHYDAHAAVPVIWSAACMWKDDALWNRATEAWESVAEVLTLEDRDIEHALDAFGFDKAQSGYVLFARFFSSVF